MGTRKYGSILIIFVLCLLNVSSKATPITQQQEVSNEIIHTDTTTAISTPITTTTATNDKPVLQGKYFDEIMKELNEALKEKAAEERRHLSLLMNMTAEMKELSEQVKGMKEKLKKIAAE